MIYLVLYHGLLDVFELPMFVYQLLIKLHGVLLALNGADDDAGLESLQDGV